MSRVYITTFYYVLMAVLMLAGLAGLYVRYVRPSEPLGQVGLLVALADSPLLLAGQSATLWSSAFEELRMNVIHPLALVSQGLGLVLFAIAVKRRAARPRRSSVVLPALLTGLLSIAALVTFGVVHSTYRPAEG